MAFGAFVRQKREELGIPLNEFARRLEISPAYWSRIERDIEKPPKNELIEKAAALLEIATDELFIEAERFPPDMQQNVAHVVRAYRRLDKPGR